MPVDLNHGSGYVPYQAPKPANAARLGEALTELLDVALLKETKRIYELGRGKGNEDVARNRIGAAYIAKECDRELAYRYHRVEKEDRKSVVSPGELQRHAEVGHWTEHSMAHWMRLAGFDVRTHKTDDAGNYLLDEHGNRIQYGFRDAIDPVTGQARIAGEIDGVILGVPQRSRINLPLPCLWESKKATAKKWGNFSKNGVRRADSDYYGQVQVNMAEMDVPHTLFSMLNVDSMKIYWELIEFNAALAQKLIDRAVLVIRSAAPEDMMRIAFKPDFYKCKFCDFHGRCWSGR